MLDKFNCRLGNFFFVNISRPVAPRWCREQS